MGAAREVDDAGTARVAHREHSGRGVGAGSWRGIDVSKAKFAPPQPKDKQEILAAFESAVSEGEDRGCKA